MLGPKKLVSLVTTLLLSMAWPVCSQQKSTPPVIPPPAQRKVARPGLEARRLAFLVGAWDERVKYPGAAPNQKAEEGTGRWVARPVLGRFLQFNYDGSGPQGPYRALGMLIYDSEAQEYRMFWFDDTGGVGDYRGNFVDENTLRLEHRGKVEGRDFRERISFVRISPAVVRTKIEQAWDAGEYRVFLEAQATRTGPPPAGPPPRREPAPTRPPGD